VISQKFDEGNMKNLMLTLKAGYQSINSSLQSQFSRKLKESKINLPRTSKEGFNLDGYLIRSYSWKSLIKTLYMDKLMLIKKNVTIKQALDTSPMDKYLSKVWNQLYKYAKRGDKDKFVKLYEFIVKRSFALRLQLMFKVQPKWTIDMSYKSVRFWYRTLDWNLKHLEPMFKYKRIMIPKKNSEELRPLSVPDLVSRGIARCQFQILNCWCEGQNVLDQKFYGSRRKHGASAAWKYIYEKVRFAKFIWEFDFSKYYDTINVVQLQRALHANNIPAQIVGWIAASIAVSQESLREETWSTERKQLYEKTKLWSVKEWMKAEYLLKTSPWKYIIRCIPGLRNYLNILMQVNTTGIPQGYALGPLLAALYIAPYLKDFDKELIIYIDDGIIFTNDESKIQKFQNIMENLEIKLSEEKCFWVKKEGKWLSKLKFLGIIYDPWKEEIENLKKDDLNGYRSQKDKSQSIGMNYWRMLKKDWKIEAKIWNKMIAYIYDPDPNNWNAFKMADEFQYTEKSFTGLKKKWFNLRKNRTQGIRIKFTTVHSDIYGYIMFRKKL